MFGKHANGAFPTRLRKTNLCASHRRKSPARSLIKSVNSIDRATPVVLAIDNRWRACTMPQNRNGASRLRMQVP